MAKEVKMPQMGYDMTEGRIAQWLKKPGDEVKKGDALAEIETDKVTIEIESFDNGVLLQLVAAEGATVPVGHTIAIIGAPGEKVDAAPAAAPAPAPAEGKAPVPPVDVPAPSPAQLPTSATSPFPASEAPQVAAQHEQRTTSKPARPDKIVSKDEELKGALEALRSRGKAQPHLNGREPAGQPGSNGQRIFASPVARRMAGDAGLDLASIQGSGPGGRIVRADVEQAVARGVAPAAAAQPVAQPAGAAAQPAVTQQPAAQPAAQPAGESRPLSRMRRAIARKMVESKTQIPHFYVTSAIVMDEALAFRKRLNEGLSKEESISVTDLIIKAAALALTKFPDLYASFAGDAINYSQEVNVSVAVALDEGLVAPVVRDCGSRSVGAISRDLKAAVERARSGKTQPQELEGGNFTVSNLGMFDVEEFIAIITAPQASALAIASTKQEPVVRNGEIAIANVMRATISVDHRVSDGAYAARYLQELKSLLENPLRLML